MGTCALGAAKPRDGERPRTSERLRRTLWNAVRCLPSELVAMVMEYAVPRPPSQSALPRHVSCETELPDDLSLVGLFVYVTREDDPVPLRGSHASPFVVVWSDCQPPFCFVGLVWPTTVWKSPDRVGYTFGPSQPALHALTAREGGPRYVLTFPTLPESFNSNERLVHSIRRVTLRNLAESHRRGPKPDCMYPVVVAQIRLKPLTRAPTNARFPILFLAPPDHPHWPWPP